MDVRVLRADLVKPHFEGIRRRRRTAGWSSSGSGRGTAFEHRHDGAAAYFATEYHLLRGLFDDELGPLAQEYVGRSASWQSMIGLLDDPTSDWWDNVKTAGRTESAPDVIAAALDAAGADLRTSLGDPKDWTWGLAPGGLPGADAWDERHRAARVVLQQGPDSVAGASGAIVANYYRPSRAYPDPNDADYEPVGFVGVFEVTNLPSYRLTIDMGDLDGARIVQTTGQSGNPFDSHYGDLIDEWAAGPTVPLPFSWTGVEAATEKRLELVP